MLDEIEVKTKLLDEYADCGLILRLVSCLREVNRIRCLIIEMLMTVRIRGAKRPRNEKLKSIAT